MLRSIEVNYLCKVENSQILYRLQHYIEQNLKKVRFFIFNDHKFDFLLKSIEV